jgi:hypothetical protein
MRDLINVGEGAPLRVLDKNWGIQPVLRIYEPSQVLSRSCDVICALLRIVLKDKVFTLDVLWRAMAGQIGD